MAARSLALLLVSQVAAAAPPSLGPTACRRSTNAVVATVALGSGVTAGTRLVVGIWWSGNNAQVVSVTDSLGNLYGAITPPVVAMQGSDVFTLAVYETIAGFDGTPNLTVAMNGVPLNQGTSLIDLSLLAFTGVTELGSSRTLSGTGLTLTAGPIVTLVPDELIVAYAGSSQVLTAAGGGLTTVTTCFGDWTATRVAPTPGSWGGDFTGPATQAWGTITFSLRPTAASVAPDAGAPDAGPADAGASDAGATDAGGNDAGPRDAGSPDAGAIGAEPDGGQQEQGTYLVGCSCGAPGPLAGLALALVLLRRRAQRLP